MANRKIQIDYTPDRTTGFLLGLVFALTLLLCSLEWHSGGPQTADIDDDDDASFDPELLARQQRNDMIAYLKPGTRAKAVTQKIKVVDQQPEAEVPSKIDQPSGIADEGNGSGNQGEATDQQQETTAQAPVATDMNDNPLNFRVVEKLPEFPGGMVEFMKWITRNLRYPQAAQQKKIQGRVMVGFIIGKDGSVSELKVVKSADPLLDQEALRVMRLMPKWKPGEDKGKPCLTYFCIPVNFKL